MKGLARLIVSVAALPFQEDSRFHRWLQDEAATALEDYADIMREGGVSPAEQVKLLRLTIENYWRAVYESYRWN